MTCFVSARNDWFSRQAAVSPAVAPPTVQICRLPLLSSLFLSTCRRLESPVGNTESLPSFGSLSAGGDCLVLWGVGCSRGNSLLSVCCRGMSLWSAGCRRSNGLLSVGCCRGTSLWSACCGRGNGLLSLVCSRCKSLCGAGWCQGVGVGQWCWVLDGAVGSFVTDGTVTALVLDSSVRWRWNRKALVWSAGPEVVSGSAVEALVWSATPVVVSDGVAEVVVATVWAVAAAAEGWVAATEAKAVVVAVKVLMRAARPMLLDVAAAAVHTGRTGDP